jgi:hypothetical protein
MVRREKLMTLLTGWPPDMNMSYCRFENTSKAMSDCLDAIMDGDYTDLTSHERQGLIDILAYCDDILDHREDIEEELDVLQAKYD